MTNLRDMLVRKLALCAALVLLPALAGRAAAQEVEWRYDYARARQEATEKGRPILIDFFTNPCVWCKRLDEGPFRDPALVQLLNSRFIPLKVDGSRNPTLAQFLKIQNYPTMVFAGTDGRVLGLQEGFLETHALKDQLERVLAAVAEPEWMQRSFADALKAREAGEFAKALALLKPILEEGKGRSIHARALQQVRDLEQLVKAQAQRTAEQVAAVTGPRVPDPAPQSVITNKPPVEQTKPPEVPAVAAAPQKPLPIRTVNPVQSPETTQLAMVPPPPPPLTAPLQRRELIPPEPSQVVVALSELSRMLKGTFGTRHGAQMLVTLVSQTDSPEQIRVRQAKDLLYQAQQDYQKQHYLACLDRCQMLIASYGDLPTESLAALRMETEIRKNPEWVKLACDQLGDRLSVMYLNLAETWLAKGEPQQAMFYLERVIQTAPNTRYAETAQVRLTQLQGQPMNRSADPKR